ncbi:hypothetical protein [Nocardioides sp. CFH 31398]|uniref:hypothetical protein n=1 Tax=Nocardioides sp. CFH 31398 TaxID=2919579 RepID=UPI001F06636F|nr:hypothetical protein [Nocardioides sp. CFH 31398]MCH1866385.1 hypothetical protein [Nocardioides sp. CFH 31398]
MTDLETRLRESLQRAAADAPTAVGLAVRVRARRPRRTALAWTTGVLVAAVVVLVAVVPRLIGSTGGEVGVSDSSSAPQTSDDRWRDVRLTEGGENPIELELPEDFPEGGVTTFPASERDRLRPPGSVRTGIDSVFGQVLVGNTVVWVDVLDSPRTVRRVLASARPGGTSAVDVTGWETETVADSSGEITVQVPDDPRVEVLLSPGLPDCDPGRFPARPDDRGGWAAYLCRDRFVTVRAPTQALADVVAATVRGY